MCSPCSGIPANRCCQTRAASRLSRQPARRYRSPAPTHKLSPVGVQVHAQVDSVLPQEAQVLPRPRPPQHAEGLLLRWRDDDVDAPHLARRRAEVPEDVVVPAEKEREKPCIRFNHVWPIRCPAWVGVTTSPRHLSTYAATTYKVACHVDWTAKWLTRRALVRVSQRYDRTQAELHTSRPLSRAVIGTVCILVKVAAPVARQVVQLEEAGLLSLRNLLAQGFQVVWHAVRLNRHLPQYISGFTVLTLNSDYSLARSLHSRLQCTATCTCNACTCYSCTQKACGSDWTMTMILEWLTEVWHMAFSLGNSFPWASSSLNRSSTTPVVGLHAHHHLIATCH